MTIDDVIVKSATDEAFRAALLAQPADTLSAAGIRIPEGIRIRIVESTADHLRIAIPPALPDDVELDEEALAGTAGGTSPVVAFTVTVVGGFGLSKLL